MTETQAPQVAQEIAPGVFAHGYTVTTSSGLAPITFTGGREGWLTSAIECAVMREYYQPREHWVILDPDGYIVPRSEWAGHIETLKSRALETLEAIAVHKHAGRQEAAGIVSR